MLQLGSSSAILPFFEHLKVPTTHTLVITSEQICLPISSALVSLINNISVPRKTAALTKVSQNGPNITGKK